jgi:hypothetical protein
MGRSAPRPGQAALSAVDCPGLASSFCRLECHHNARYCIRVLCPVLSNILFVRPPASKPHVGRCPPQSQRSAPPVVRERFNVESIRGARAHPAARAPGGCPPGPQQKHARAGGNKRPTQAAPVPRPALLVYTPYCAYQPPWLPANSSPAPTLKS